MAAQSVLTHGLERSAIWSIVVLVTMANVGLRLSFKHL